MAIRCRVCLVAGIISQTRTRTNVSFRSCGGLFAPCCKWCTRIHTTLAAYDCKMRFPAGTMFQVEPVPVTDGWQTPRLRQVCHTIIYGLPCGDSGVFRAAGTIASNSPIQGNGASLDIALNLSEESWRPRRRRRRPSGPLSAPFVACRVAAVTADDKCLNPRDIFWPFHAPHPSKNTKWNIYI